MGIFDKVADALARGGDIVSRPSYALGNLYEALGYQVANVLTNPTEEKKNEVKGVIGETNPFKALWGGLSGEDKVGPGDAVGRLARFNAENNYGSDWMATAFDNPATKIGLNIVTDPAVGTGALARGTGKVGTALGTLGQADDAGRFAKIAGKIATPERVQNVNLAAKAIESNPAFTLPAAALMGGARRFIPGVDDAIERLYSLGRKGRVTDDLVQETTTNQSLLPELVDRPVVGPPRPAINDLGTGLEPFVQAERLGQPLAVGPSRVAGELNPAPVPRPQGGPQAAAAEALNAGMPSPAALPRGARAMGMGPISSPGVSGEARMLALKNALGGKGLEAVKGNRGAGGRFLNQAVVQDAEQLRALLQDPETRDQTMRMLLELVK